jgi:endonuclease/exonuclease/phosphatase (EEP) superfamily protein YafD
MLYYALLNRHLPNGANYSNKRFMKYVAIAFSLIPAALLIASAGGAIHPLGDSLAVFRFHLGLLALIGVAQLFYVHKFKFALGLLMLCVAASGAIWHNSRPQTLQTSSPYHLYQKNLSFRMANHGPVIADIRKQKPQFLTLQEVTDRHKAILTAVSDILPTQHYCSFAAVGGVALASSFPAIPNSAFCAQNDDLAAIQLATPDGPVWLVSIHLHWPYPFEQAEQVERLLPSLTALTGPVILAGDFNMVPWSNTLTQIEQATGSHRLGHVNGTFLLKNTLLLPIDHVLGPSNCPDQVSTLDLLGSDHHGVLASFAIASC